MTYLTDLIEALRRELQQYGEMLARCDEAESHLTQNAAQAARTKLKALQEQEGVIERLNAGGSKSNAGWLGACVCRKRRAWQKSFPCSHDHTNCS